MINYLDKPLRSCTHVYKDPDLVSQPRFLVSCVFVSSITFLTCHIGIFLPRKLRRPASPPAPVHTLGFSSGRAHPLFPDSTFTASCIPHTLPLLVPGPSALPGLCPQPVLCPASTPSSFHGQDSSFGRANSNTIAFVKPSQSFTNKERPPLVSFLFPQHGVGSGSVFTTRFSLKE